MARIKKKKYARSFCLKLQAESMIKRLEEKTQKKLTKYRMKLHKLTTKEISGFIAPSDTKTDAFINGKYQRDGYSVGKYAIMGEGDYAIPILLFVPNDNNKKHPALVYLHPLGKVTEAKPRGEIEKLVRKGYIVAAADVIGVGETKNTASRGHTSGYLAVSIGRSIIGIQAGDIIRVVNYLKNLNDIDPKKVGAIGMNELCIPLLHAAAFEPSINNVFSSIGYRLDFLLNLLAEFKIDTVDA